MLLLVLLDDAALHNEQLTQHLHQLIDSERLDATIALSTTNAQAVLDFARTNHQPTVYFLDIELEKPDYNGVDVCRTIHTLDANAYIVYISAHLHYSMECVKSHAFDFLEKPFTHASLRECLLAVIHDVKRKGEHNLYLPIGSRTERVDQAQITHFTIDGDQITVHLLNQRTLVFRGSFSDLIPKLTPGSFLRVYRDTLVNLKYIDRVDGDGKGLILLTGEALSVSRRNKQFLRNVLKPESW